MTAIAIHAAVMERVARNQQECVLIRCNNSTFAYKFYSLLGTQELTLRFALSFTVRSAAFKYTVYYTTTPFLENEEIGQQQKYGHNVA
jgi:hypothetical protein